MHRELTRCFPGTDIGQSPEEAGSLDMLTGVFGCSVMAAIFGIPQAFDRHTWPVTLPSYLSTSQLEQLEVPDLTQNAFYQDLLTQVDEIAELQGPVAGFVNWQGVLNNALKLRGQQIFLDLVDKPELCHHVFSCICEAMISGLHLLHQKQRATGLDYDFATVSNCCVNMLSPDQYAEFILPYDRRIAGAFGVIGVHNCAWNADPYLEHYASIPDLGYIDMGLESNLARARDLIPNARRALMYTPMDLAQKSWEEIRRDVERFVDTYAPCDIVVADIDSDVPDERVIALAELCQHHSERNQA
jgi:hypothetical protein